MTEVGGIAVDRLRSLIERIERLEEEKAAIASDIRVSAGELDDLAGRPDVVLVDVRSRREYARSHIRSAVNMPWEEGISADRLPAGKLAVCYCEHGSSSMMAARELIRQGRRAGSVIGGISEYRGRNLVFFH